MSCKICLNLKRSFKKNDGFLKKVNGEINDGRFVELGQIDKDSSKLTVRYRCKICGQAWLYTHPDWNFRGDFSEDTDALTVQAELT